MTPPASGVVSSSYDANGSLIGRGSDTFSWDAANRLSSLSVGGTTTSMSYSGDGLRATRTSGGVTTSYVWDVESGELLDDGTYQYVYGLGAGPLERVTISSQATVYYLPDGLGSTAAIVDQSGTTVQSYTYDVYGQATASSQSFGNEVQFAGQQTDPSGLQYLRARYYDPSSGQFLSRDPAPSCTYNPAAHHPYSYASNSPASKADPSGLYDTGLVNGQIFQDPNSGAYSIYSSATGGLVPVPAAQAPQLAASIQLGAALLQTGALGSAGPIPQPFDTLAQLAPVCAPGQQVYVQYPAGAQQLTAVGAEFSYVTPDQSTLTFGGQPLASTSIACSQPCVPNYTITPPPLNFPGLPFTIPGAVTAVNIYSVGQIEIASSDPRAEPYANCVQ